MQDRATIAVDMVGGDEGFEVMVEGARAALSADKALSVIACGPAEVVEPFAAAHERAEACVATQAIGMGEHPASAVRAKPDSSIVVGCRLVREGRADGFFSPGSTGACLAAATLVVGRLKGVKRPALAQLLPGHPSPTVLLDVGANADCKPEYLAQFGVMGEVYAQCVLGIERPRVALLNIGSEEAKGSALAQASYGALEAAVRGFVGNCEANDLLKGAADVVVTDGFTGNVALKAIEGCASTLFGYVRRALMSSPKAKVGALLAKGSLGALKEELSPSAYGGAPLLGVRGACLVGHGSSDAKAVRSGILMAARTARADVPALIQAGVAAAHDAKGDGDGAH